MKEYDCIADAYIRGSTFSLYGTRPIDEHSAWADNEVGVLPHCHQLMATYT